LIKQDEKLGNFIAVVAHRLHLPQNLGRCGPLDLPWLRLWWFSIFLLKGDKFRLATLLESRSREILTQVYRHVLFNTGP